MADTITSSVPAPASQAAAGTDNQHTETSRWVWSAMTPAERETKLQELTGWVDWLLATYPKLHSKVPVCWYQHTDVIEHLTALFLGWVRTYAGDPAKLTLRSEIEWVSALHTMTPHLAIPACQAKNAHVDAPPRPQPDGVALESWMDSDPGSAFLNAEPYNPGKAEAGRMAAAALAAAEKAKAQKGQ
ncbi:hypothetical protein ABT224_33420 [Streptomyces sp. NPDC001584]|uniref:hypothetical protein n=1 Tax=Streptomyces sp. NPDC001584 TaxID=3154521 RepID=UPI00332F572B